jgi:hypothetical protein
MRIIVRHPPSDMETLIKFNPPKLNRSVKPSSSLTNNNNNKDNNKKMMTTMDKNNKKKRNNSKSSSGGGVSSNVSTQMIIDQVCRIFGLDNTAKRYGLAVRVVSSSGRDKVVPVDLVSSLEDGDECELVHLSTSHAKSRHEAAASCSWSRDMNVNAFVSSMGSINSSNGHQQHLQKSQKQQRGGEKVAAMPSSTTFESTEDDDSDNDSPHDNNTTNSSKATSSKHGRKTPPPGNNNTEEKSTKSSTATTEESESGDTAIKKKPPVVIKKKINKLAEILVFHPVGTVLAVEMAPGYFYEATLIHYQYKGTMYKKIPPSYDPKKADKLFSKLKFEKATNERGENGRIEELDLRCYRHFVISDDLVNGDDDTVKDFVMLYKTMDLVGNGNGDTSVNMKVIQPERKPPSCGRRKVSSLPQVGDAVSVKFEARKFEGRVARTRWIKDYEPSDVDVICLDDESSRFYALIEYDDLADRCWSVFDDGPGSKQQRTVYVNKTMRQWQAPTPCTPGAEVNSLPSKSPPPEAVSQSTRFLQSNITIDSERSPPSPSIRSASGNSTDQDTEPAPSPTTTPAAPAVASLPLRRGLKRKAPESSDDDENVEMKFQKLVSGNTTSI